MQKLNQEECQMTTIQDTKPTDTELVFDDSIFSTREWYKEQGFIRTDRDEFNSKATFQEIARVAARYQFDKMKTEIESLRVENAILREELARCAYDFKYICKQPGIADKVNHALNKTAADKVRGEG